MALVRTGTVGATLFLNGGSSGNDVVASSFLGRLAFNGFDGTDYRTGAFIEAAVDGTPGAGSMPGRIVLSTTPSGSATPTERLRITSDGRLGLGTSSPSEILELGSGNIKLANVGRIFSVDSTRGSIQISAPNDSTTRRVTYGSNYYLDSDLTYKQASAVIGGCLIELTAPNADYGTFKFIQKQDPDSGGATRDAFIINQAGNVGIGTTSPANLLHIQGDATFEANAGGQFAIRGSTDTANRLNFGFETTNNYAWIQSITVGTAFRPIALNPSGGRVGIGTGATAPGGTLDIKAPSATAPLIIQGPSSEFARIDSSGRLLVGASTNYTVGDSSGWSLQLANSAGLSNLRTGDNSFPSSLTFGKTRAAAAGSFAIVQNNDIIGNIDFAADDGTDYATIAARIRCQVDGTPGVDDMPGRLTFFVTLDGAAAPIEALRITNDRVVAYNQAAPAAVNATATLTVANLKTGIITSTSAAATDMTLPTGTDTEGGFSGIYTNMTFEWSVINTGPSLVTVLANTAHTLVGSGAVVTGTSARFASRRTAGNTFVTYRLS
jgi:hypothetical protein